MLSRDTDEEHFMHWKSDNKEIMINDKRDTVIKKIFDYAILLLVMLICCTANVIK